MVTPCWCPRLGPLFRHPPKVLMARAQDQGAPAAGGWHGSGSAAIVVCIRQERDNQVHIDDNSNTQSKLANVERI